MSYKGLKRSPFGLVHHDGDNLTSVHIFKDWQHPAGKFIRLTERNFDMKINFRNKIFPFVMFARFYRY